MKTCSKCDVEKPLSEFYKRSDTGKYRSSCKKCWYISSKRYVDKNRGKVNKYNRDYNKTNPTRAKKSYIKSTYGLTWEEYTKLYNSQQGKCAICNKYITIEVDKSRTSTACVDHNHETGEVRGILCDSCNKGIGYLKDNIMILENAIKYLNRGRIY